MGDEDQVQDVGELEMPDQMGGSLEDLLGPSLGYEPEAETDENGQTQTDEQDTATVKINGKDLRVPKDVAAALAQGRRFQGDRDRLEEANKRHQQEVGELRQQMQQMQQMFMQSMQVKTMPQSQGPSPIQMAFAQADEAVAAGTGVLKAIGPVLEQYIESSNKQTAAKLDQILQAAQQQQARLQEIDQKTHVSSIQREVLDGIKYRQQEDGVELTPEQQEAVVGRFMAMQEASGYDRNALQGHFLSAYYQTAFEAAKSGSGVKPPAPSTIFNRRPPVGAPIIPRNAGTGVAASSRSGVKLPSTVDILQG